MEKPEMVVVKTSQKYYEETLEWLGEGIMIDQPGNGGLAVLPLPRYRRRTVDGRHER